ncbi:MAG: Arc family DNA-binding protein [Cyclobacteriaceae bacterium]|nr:Arc family DNA-binding protein [Cyclobacteriaceae bacterium]
MANITIKNMPDELYKIVKLLAKNHQRSLNNELIYRIQKSVGSERVDPEKIRAQAKEFRSRIKVKLSPEEIERAINYGRE